MWHHNREAAIRRSPPALGASGSVNASVMFNILYSPFSTVLIYGILPMPAWALGGLWLAYDVSGAMVSSYLLRGVHLRQTCPSLCKMDDAHAPLSAWKAVHDASRSVISVCAYDRGES